MGYVLKLPTAGAASLPTLGDIGYISKQNLKGLYLINGGDGRSDASGSGHALTLYSGSVTPPYAAGVLQFRALTVGAQVLSTGILVPGTDQTVIIAVKKTAQSGVATAPMYFGYEGVDLVPPLCIDDGTYGAPGYAVVWGRESKRPQVNYAGTGIGLWHVWTGVRTATNVGLSLDGQPATKINYDTTDTGGYTLNMTIGASGRAIDGDIGFAAIYDRALSDAEIASAYKAVKRLMAGKGITI